MTNIPTDWKFVPVKPTHQMETAIGKSRNLSASEIWEDAITAAPVQVLQPTALVTSLVVGPDGVVRAGLDRELPLMTEVYTQQPQRQLLTDKEVAYILAQLPVPPVNDGKALHDWAMQAVRELANTTAAPPSLDYSGLYDYAQANKLNYNELCTVVRTACGIKE